MRFGKQCGAGGVSVNAEQLSADLDLCTLGKNKQLQVIFTCGLSPPG